MGGPGSGRRPGGGAKKSSGGTFSVSPAKMKSVKIPKALKKKWAKSGGVNNPEYKAWVKKNWAS